MFRYLEGTKDLPLHIRGFSSFDQDFIRIGSFDVFWALQFTFPE